MRARTANVAALAQARTSIPAGTATRARIALVVLLLLAGCEVFHSDSENFVRQQHAERERRVAGMRAATQQAATGQRLTGDALARAVRGRTHVFTYAVAPGRYVEYSFFRADGHFVYRNSQWATDPDGREGDRWRVSDEYLCVVSGEFTPDERCYALTALPDGRVQYFIHAPGDETDGLLTKVTDATRDGTSP